MRAVRALLAIVFALTLTAFGCGSGSAAGGGGGGGGGTVTVPTFDSGRSFADLQTQCDFGPRNPGSGGRNACLTWLKTQFGAQTASLQDQSFTFHGANGTDYAGNNVIARFAAAPASTTPPLLIGAHWDTRPVADQDTNPANRNTPILGANDGASGVAVLLELARLFKASPPPRPIILACWDLEDMGQLPQTAGQPLYGFCLGSRYFAANPTGAVPSEGVNLDMIGDANLYIYREQNSATANPTLISSLFTTANKLGFAQFVNQVGEAVTDDHVPLIDAGIAAVDLIDFDYPGPNSNRYWHTVADTPDKCSPESLRAVGQTLLAIIYSNGTTR